jgi:RND family efflux transporter MFP subunit
MNTRTLAALAATCGLTLLAVLAFAPAGSAQDSGAAKAGGKPALTVTTIKAQRLEFPLTVQATGNIAAWQEAIIGAETGGLRLAEVRVNVGDVVRRGQVLAAFAAETINAELAQARAGLAEAEATLGDARANAARAREVEGSGALSQQQIAQYMTAEKTAEARLQSLRAQLTTQELRLRQSTVVAPDGGSISARSATVGAVVPQGQELFRLIRGDRLEWRAELTSAEVARIRPGQTVNVIAASGAKATGRVRVVAPTVDPQTRNALVFVDLPATAARDGGFKAGMFARGDLATGQANALTLPLAAVSLRDGFSYVFAVKPDTRVVQMKIQLGRRTGERVEVLGALNGSERLVASGAAFLADGDLVRVVDK